MGAPVPWARFAQSKASASIHTNNPSPTTGTEPLVGGYPRVDTASRDAKGSNKPYTNGPPKTNYAAFNPKGPVTDKQGPLNLGSYLKLWPPSRSPPRRQWTPNLQSPRRTQSVNLKKRESDAFVATIGRTSSGPSHRRTCCWRWMQRYTQTGLTISQSPVTPATRAVGRTCGKAD